MYLNGSLVLVFKIAKRSIKLHPTKEVEPTEIEKNIKHVLRNSGNQETKINVQMPYFWNQMIICMQLLHSEGFQS